MKMTRQLLSAVGHNKGVSVLLFGGLCCALGLDSPSNNLRRRLMVWEGEPMEKQLTAEEQAAADALKEQAADTAALLKEQAEAEAAAKIELTPTKMEKLRKALETETIDDIETYHAEKFGADSKNGKLDALEIFFSDAYMSGPEGEEKMGAGLMFTRDGLSAAKEILTPLKGSEGDDDYDASFNEIIDGIVSDDSSDLELVEFMSNKDFAEKWSYEDRMAFAGEHSKWGFSPQEFINEIDLEEGDGDGFLDTSELEEFSFLTTDGDTCCCCC